MKNLQALLAQYAQHMPLMNCLLHTDDGRWVIRRADVPPFFFGDGPNETDESALNLAFPYPPFHLTFPYSPTPTPINEKLLELIRKFPRSAWVSYGDGTFAVGSYNNPQSPFSGTAPNLLQALEEAFAAQANSPKVKEHQKNCIADRLKEASATQANSPKVKDTIVGSHWDTIVGSHWSSRQRW